MSAYINQLERRINQLERQLQQEQQLSEHLGEKQKEHMTTMMDLTAESLYTSHCVAKLPIKMRYLIHFFVMQLVGTKPKRNNHSCKLQNDERWISFHDIFPILFVNF